MRLFKIFTLELTNAISLRDFITKVGFLLSRFKASILAKVPLILLELMFKL